MDFGRISKNSKYSESKEDLSPNGKARNIKYSLYNKRASNDIDGIASPESPTVTWKSTVHASSPGEEQCR